MKFMLIRRADSNTENGTLPSQSMLSAMADYNARMIQAGVLVSGNGLRPTSDGCLIHFDNGAPTIIPGPLSPASERIAGYSVLEAPSLKDAIEWAKQWPTMDADGKVTLELRRYFSLEDFEPGDGLEQHRHHARIPDAMNVYVGFPGTCREAMAFYADVTGGHLECLLTYAETPAAEHTPPALHDRIIHASLNLRGRRLMGADMATETYTAPQGVQVQLEYQDIDQAATTFARLADGGKIIMPFEATFWSSGFGMATDRFGIQWMINVASDNHCPLATEGDAP
ncbi:YciI family protein [Vreelandella zhaodongensis]|uniref:VOC family protein n=1 Tax=Vreelandella zhaodongensis TaxID=1176240 RepID=A0ABX2SUQ1_VREZH|nr:YciI family protein [Halomonas zhaodongensis]NYS45887.1 VOC family protein [Halomonas zhaodongensis]